MKNKIFFSFILGIALLFPIFSYAQDAEYQTNASPYNAIGLNEAYSLGFTGTGVTVAVVDNGTLLTHEAFKNNVSELQQEDFNYGANTHGTPVAGVVAAAKDGLGSHGVAYGASILAFGAQLGDDPDCPECYTVDQAWSKLAEVEFDSVKIINNSWGGGITGSGSADTILLNIARTLVIKDKLIIFAAGNETSFQPSADAGLPYYDASLKYNFISTVAFNPAYSKDSPYFLSGFTNLAGHAKEWTVVAPGQGLYAPSSLGGSAYAGFSGTSAAAPVVSGVAALVSDAFPYMGGKQIADVIFSTTTADFKNFSNYLIQNPGNGTPPRFLFFGMDDGYGKAWTDAEKNAIVMAELGNGKTCASAGVECNDVTYAEVFGYGIIHAGRAVRGPGYLDANRLKNSSDYDGVQYVYTVDTQTYDSLWSNNIGQKKSENGHLDADVGLKKMGSSILTLSGKNTYKGTTQVYDGTLKLTGSIAGDINVDMAGNFQLTGGTVYGDVASIGKLTIDNGVLQNIAVTSGTGTMSAGVIQGDFLNSADFTVGGGTFKSAFENTGTFRLNGGTVEKSILNSGSFYMAGGSVYKPIINTGSFYLNENVLRTTVENTGGTFYNNTTFLSRNIVSGGTIVNSGIMGTAHAPETFINHGAIVLQATQDRTTLEAMFVQHLNLVQGHFSVDLNNLPRFEANTSYLVFQSSGTFTVAPEFERTSWLSDFVTAETLTDNTVKTVSVSLDYKDLSSQTNAPNLTPKERQVAGIFDRMFKTENKETFAGYYFLNEQGVKQEMSRMFDQIRPMSFTSLPLTGSLTRNIHGHLYNRQKAKEPDNYKGNWYRGPASTQRRPKGTSSDVYKNYRPEAEVPQQNYQHYVPRQPDVYQNYRPNAEPPPAQNYRHRVPKQPDVYKNFRPTGRSGGNMFGTKKEVWGQLLFGKTTISAASGSPLSDAEGNNMGLMFGWDFILSDNFLWGLTVGYGMSNLDQDSDKLDMTDLRFGAYFSRQREHLSIDGMFILGLQDYDKKRVTTLPTGTFESKGSFGGMSIEASVNVGYDLQQVPLTPGDLSFKPYIGLNILHMSQDSYTEKGASDLNLAVSDVTDTSVILQPGIIGGMVTEGSSLFLFEPQYIFADLRYQYVVTGNSPKVSASFSADPLRTSFDSFSEDDKSAFVASVGVNGKFSDKVKMNLLFSYRSSDQVTSQTISATLIYNW